MPLSNPYKKNIVTAVFGDDFAIPSAYYVALFSVAPTASTYGTELAGSGYARVAVPNDNTEFDTSANPVVNLNNIAFPVASADWTTAVAWALMDHISAAALANEVISAALAAPVTILNGGQAQFPPGALTLTCT